ncbi:GM18687 [Drosophila sechellia]|uniref:GM18687 n=1 Tax=Drosophila sechellia TaxID=7238 RepID=B4I258_DROSE|nr:GM18687 [Drosophila sechellia]
MKAVIFVLAVVVAMTGKAQAVCKNDPQYTEKIDPVVCNKAGFKLPNYENATLYYQCTTQVQSGVSVLTASDSCAQRLLFTMPCRDA